MTPSLFEPTWDFEGERNGATTRAVQLGRQAGAKRLGETLYELESGAIASPLHFHHGACSPPGLTVVLTEEYDRLYRDGIDI
jgi:hypothetical protein